MDGLNSNGFDKPRQATIKCATISQGQFSEEVIVTLDALDGPLTGFFPQSFIDMTSGTIQVFVISEQGDRYLIDLPSPTVTSGSKAWFLKSSVTLQRV